MAKEKTDMERILEEMDRCREGDENAFDGMTILLDNEEKILEEDR